MGELNGGRPLPWHDMATCESPPCRGPMVPVRDMPNGCSGPAGSRIACAACGIARVGTAEDVARTERSHRAFLLLEKRLIHDDRGCARCNGPLPLERFRLCVDCVAADNAERQVPLFPEVTGHA